MNKGELKLDWCSHEAAKWAVEHWHYSRRMPSGKRVQIGVWEMERFVGVVIFGTGACPQIADPFGIKRTEAAELVRVALIKHESPVSRIVAISVRMVAKLCPKLRVIVSYADPEQGHYGGIYQAGNWLYLGKTKPEEWFVDTATGQRIHTKTLKTGRRGYATQLKRSGHIRAIHLVKHKYAMGLDREMKEQLATYRKPYPKCAGSADSGTTCNQQERGGASPTSALSIEE